MLGREILGDAGGLGGDWEILGRDVGLLGPTWKALGATGTGCWQVNGSWVTPPFHVAPDTWIVPSGHRVLLLTADGLRVSWDGAGGLDIWPPR